MGNVQPHGHTKKGNASHYVNGGTDVEDREAVREIVERSNNNVILASYGTFSTGVNIKRIDNIVFASPSQKSNQKPSIYR